MELSPINKQTPSEYLFTSQDSKAFICHNVSTLQLMLRNTSHCIQVGFEPEPLGLCSPTLPTELLCLGLYI